MREQRAQHTPIPRRASATTEQQALLRRRAILPASYQRAEHVAAMHPEDLPYQTRQQRASYDHLFNATDAGEQDEGFSMRRGTSVIDSSVPVRDSRGRYSNESSGRSSSNPPIPS